MGKFIEVTKKDGRREMINYDVLNDWLRQNAMYAVIECYYTDGDNDCRYFEVVDGQMVVLYHRDCMELVRIRIRRD